MHVSVSVFVILCVKTHKWGTVYKKKKKSVYCGSICPSVDDSLLPLSLKVFS